MPLEPRAASPVASCLVGLAFLLVLLASSTVLGPPASAGATADNPAVTPTRSVVPCGLPEYAQARVEDVARRLSEDPLLLDGRAVDLDRAQRDRLTSTVAAADHPVWVAALAGFPDSVDPTEVACTLANAAPDPVSVVVLLGPDHLPALGGDATVGAEQDVDQRTYLAVQADLDETGSEAERLLLLVDRVTGQSPLPDQGTGSGRVPTTQEPDDTIRSGRSGTLVLGAGVVGLVVAVVLLRIHHVRSGGRRTRRLLASVSRGRATGSRIATRRAVRELGDRLERLDLDPGDDAASWQHALDAYDAASRQLDRATGPADLEQVRRRCSQGQDELDAIERARPGRGSR